MTKKSSEKQPWFKFYTRDWMSDEALNSCSLGAQALWLRMLCLMHRAEPYGHLTINGKKPSDERLAPALGVPVELLRGHLVELREAGVFSVSNGGVIYSRRMVRDHAASEKCAKSAQKRWEGDAEKDSARKSSSRVRRESRESSGEVHSHQAYENTQEKDNRICDSHAQKPEARIQSLRSYERSGAPERDQAEPEAGPPDLFSAPEPQASREWPPETPASKIPLSELRTLCVEALGEAANGPSLHAAILGPLMGWTDAGCELRDIVETLRARAAKKDPHTIHSWAFCGAAPVEAMAARKRAATPQPYSAPEGAPSIHAENGIEVFSHDRSAPVQARHAGGSAHRESAAERAFREVAARRPDLLIPPSRRTAH